MTNSKFEKIISLATSVCVAVLGVMFIACCAHLYFTGGDEPYSRKRVGEYLLLLIVPAVITLIGVVAGVILNSANKQTTDTKANLTKQYLLSVRAKKIDIDSFEEKVRGAIVAERKKRATVKAIFISLSAVCYIICVVYVIFFCEYSVENLSRDVMTAFAGALPFGILGVAMNVPSILLCEQSAARELDLIKGGKKIAAEKAGDGNEEVISLVAKVVIIAISALFILLGVLNGGMADVLGKAIKICTECIGLG